MTTKILYFHIFLIFCGWEACVTMSEHRRGAKDKVKRPKGGLTRSWGPYIPNFFNFHPTLTFNNSGLKPSKLKNYHIFGMPRTSAFSWYTPFRSYIWNSPLNQPSKFKKKCKDQFKITKLINSSHMYDDTYALGVYIADVIILAT